MTMVVMDVQAREIYDVRAPALSGFTFNRSRFTLSQPAPARYVIARASAPVSPKSLLRPDDRGLLRRPAARDGVRMTPTTAAATIVVLSIV